MNVFINDFYTILTHWHNLKKELRKDFDKNKDHEKILEKIIDFFYFAPMSSIVMDYEDKNNWMSPWELLKFNEYDEFAKSYIIAETYSMITKIDTKIKILIKNDKEKEKYSYEIYDENNGIVVVNSKYIKKIDNYDKIFDTVIRIYEKEKKQWKKIY